MNLFIDNVRNAWKLFSVWVGVLAVVWGSLPAEQQHAVLDLFGVTPERIPAIIGVAVLVSRIIRQRGVLDGGK